MSEARVTVTIEAVDAAREQARLDADGGTYPESYEVRRMLEAATPHLIAFPMGMTQAEWEKYVNSYR